MLTHEQVQLRNKTHNLNISRASQCGRGVLVGADPDENTLKIVPLTCGRWDCPKCSLHKAAVHAARIFAARPDRSLTLTCDPKYHTNPAAALHTMKAALPKLASRLRSLGYMFQYACVWELTKKGWPHAHLATWGEYIQQDVIQSAWQRLTGAIIVHVESLHDTKQHSHNFCKYLRKAAYVPDNILEGSRRVTYSQNYHRYKTKRPPRADDQQRVWYWVPLSAFNLIYSIIHRCIATGDEAEGDESLTLQLQELYVPTSRAMLEELIGKI